MIRNIILLILFGFAFSINAQEKPCTPTLPFIVKAESGMRMRAGPGTNNKVVVYVPTKSKVLVCKELSAPAEFENIKGHWRRIKYKDKYGYMFDGFLEPTTEGPMIPTAAADFKLAQLLVINRILEKDPKKMDSVMAYLTEVARVNGYEDLVGPVATDSAFNAKPNIAKATEEQPEVEKTEPSLDFKFLRETYNYCGDIKEIDPGKPWYAVYREGDKFVLKRVELQVLMSKYSLSNSLEFDIKTEPELHSLFLISPSRLLQPDWFVVEPEEFFDANPRTLFPGQLVEIYGKIPQADYHNIQLFATGSVISVGACPEMKDYKIKATGEMNGKLIQQDLTPLFSTLGDCGIPEIFWFGDLNEDEYPDVIFLSKANNGFTFTVLISDMNDTNALYRKTHEWFNLNCE